MNNLIQTDLFESLIQIAHHMLFLDGQRVEIDLPPTFEVDLESIKQYFGADATLKMSRDQVGYKKTLFGTLKDPALCTWLSEAWSNRHFELWQEIDDLIVRMEDIYYPTDEADETKDDSAGNE